MLCFRLLALLRSENNQKSSWVKYRQATRFLMAASLAAWWAAWDLYSLAGFLTARFPRLSTALGTESAQDLLFCVPPLAAVGAALALAYSADANFLRLKWTVIDFIKLVFWRLMNFSLPLLMVALGFADLWKGKLSGSLWICLAGIVALVGTVGLAHNPKVEWNMSEQDALDILTTASLVHRKLDQAYRYRKISA